MPLNRTKLFVQSLSQAAGWSYLELRPLPCAGDSLMRLVDIVVEWSHVERADINACGSSPRGREYIRPSIPIGARATQERRRRVARHAQ